MDVHLINHEGIEERPVEELPTLLGRQDGLVWVDIPRCDTGNELHSHAGIALDPWLPVRPDPHDAGLGSPLHGVQEAGMAVTVAALSALWL